MPAITAEAGPIDFSRYIHDDPEAGLFDSLELQRRVGLRGERELLVDPPDLPGSGSAERGLPVRKLHGCHTVGALSFLGERLG